METIPITFCNRGCHNIISNRFKSNILKQIYDSFGISINDSNKIYSEKYNNSLHKYKHAVSYVTGGAKYWLFLTKFKNINYAIYIQKKLVENHKFPKMVLSNYIFTDILYNNTLFDGELIKTYNNNWSFRITDILVYKNRVLVKNTLVDKIKILNYIFNNYYTYDTNIQTCPLIINKLYSYSDLGKLIKDVNTYNYKIIGISFKSLENNITIEFLFDKRNINCDKIKLNYLDNIDSYKISLDNIKVLMGESFHQNNEKKISINKKNSDDRSFIIKTSEYPDVYYLYGNHGKFDSIARIDSLETSSFLKKLCKSRNTSEIICKYNNLYNKWVPITI